MVEKGYSIRVGSSVEQLGTGIIRILEKYDRSIYTFSKNNIRVCFSYIVKEDLIKENVGIYDGINVGINKHEKQIINMLKVNPKITMRIIAEEIHISKRQVERIFKKLKSKNLIKRIDSNKKGYWNINIKS